ncbi:MAG: Na+/H+ antiporter NhaA [Bacteroidales bacterium]|nr:Na+/H+ antiporter NhaA [Bacteroidales bacterium]
MKTGAFNATRKYTRNAFQLFTRSGSIGGFILFFCAIIAVVVANVPSLQHLMNIWDLDMGIEVGKFSIKMDFIQWINDGLMAIFFLNVGLEIKHEIIAGELSQPKKAMLPIFAALGGMIVPALIYTFFNAGTPSANGWGIPMATDIAFAMGVLALLGKSCTIGLKVFLTALAIVDDLGSIIVLAVFYPTHAIHISFLIYAAIVMLFLLALNYMNTRNPWMYIILGLFLWYFVFKSGIHATIAGVLLAITIPAKTRINEVRFHTNVQHLLNKFKAASHSELDVISSPEQLDILHQINNRVDDISPLTDRFQVALNTPVNYLIMPLFALANAGVAFSGGIFGSEFFSIAEGVFFGLLVGKPVGIFLFSWLSIKLRLAQLPNNSTYRQLFAMGMVGSIGFTMSLFIDNLAFTNPDMVSVGKAAVLVTSAIAVILGYLAVKITGRKKKEA